MGIFFALFLENEESTKPVVVLNKGIDWQRSCFEWRKIGMTKKIKYDSTKDKGVRPLLPFCFFVMKFEWNFNKKIIVWSLNINTLLVKQRGIYLLFFFLV